MTRFAKNLNKIIQRSYESKFLYVTEGKNVDSMSGIRATVFGATSKIGITIGSHLGMIGSDVIYPVRRSWIPEYERLKYLRLSGFLGQIYVNKNTNFDDPNALHRLIKPSNVVVNMIGGKTRFNKLKQFEEANIEVARKLARVAKNSGVKKFIHFSKVGVDPQSESMDLRTRYWGEKAVRDEFPEAIILRVAPVVGFEDDVQLVFRKQQEYLNGLIIVHSDLSALRQPIEEKDVAEAFINAIKMDEANGKTFELCGPFVYTQKQLYEIMQNILERPIKFIKINPDFAKRLASIFSYSYFSLDNIIKSEIDLVGGRSEGVFKIEDLAVKPASIVPSLNFHLHHYKKNLIDTKDNTII